ncbi:MAG: hypothetical protein WCD00_00025 [Desulfuromonadaceae bacterium]
MHSYTRWATLAIETTGDINGCRVIEVALQVVEGGQVTDMFESRMNPGPCFWFPSASAECDIWPNDVSDELPAEDVWDTVSMMLQDCDVIVTDDATYVSLFVDGDLCMRDEEQWLSVIGPTDDRDEARSVFYQTYERFTGEQMQGWTSRSRADALRIIAEHMW